MLRSKGCVRVENGLCWVNLYQEGNKGFVFSVLTPIIWKLMLLQDGKSKITHPGEWASRKKVWNNNNFIIAWLSHYCFIPGTSLSILLHFKLKVLCRLTSSCVLPVKMISGDLMQTCTLPFAHVKYTGVSMIFINYLNLLTVIIYMLFFCLWCLLWYP